MLHYSEIAKLTKLCIVFNLVKMLLFLSLGIFLFVFPKGKFMENYDVENHCQMYLNDKLSLYQQPMQIVTWIMTTIGGVASLINGVNFLVFYVKTRKKLTSKIEDNLQYTPHRLIINFILDFLQSISTINIFNRSIEQFKQLSICEISQKTLPIISIVISAVIIPILLGSIVILFKILSLMKRKVNTLEEFTVYSDGNSLRENLVFNEIGYVKELLKMQNQSSRSLRNSTIKGLPSGYKKYDFSTTRDIIYKLRGGNKTTEKTSLQHHEFNTFKVEISKPIQQKNQKQDLVSISIKDYNPNELHVNPRHYQCSPNNENVQNITTTFNVLKFAIGKQISVTKSQDQSSDEQQKKKNFTNYTSNLQENINTKNLSKDKIKQINQEEELKQRFNLTPNIQARKKYSRNKNWQNIDENGHYYQVNVDRIKKKTKLLGVKKLSDNTDQTDPTAINAMYSKKQWVQRKKRVGKKHEKNVQEYLRNLSKLRKEEMLYESDDSQDENEDFVENELQKKQSEYSQSGKDSEESEEMGQVQQTKEKDDLKADQMKNKKEKKTKNEKPQLYLHMRRKKHPISENHLKLYEDEEEFYDDIDDLQSSEENIEEKMKLEAEIDKKHNKGLTKEQSSERHKAEEKIHLRNKQLDNYEAERLRFIRKKYIESKQQIEQKNNNNPVIFEDQAQKETVKQKKSIASHKQLN